MITLAFFDTASKLHQRFARYSRHSIAGYVISLSIVLFCNAIETGVGKGVAVEDGDVAIASRDPLQRRN